MCLRYEVLSSQLNDIPFIVIEDERNQKIFTFKKLEPDNFYKRFLVTHTD